MPRVSVDANAKCIGQILNNINTTNMPVRLKPSQGHPINIGFSGKLFLCKAC